VSVLNVQQRCILVLSSMIAEMMTANITVNEMILGECAEGAAEVRPPPP
jgi:hypothetical protein